MAERKREALKDLANGDTTSWSSLKDELLWVTELNSIKELKSF
jgi:hypothetical protein